MYINRQNLLISHESGIYAETIQLSVHSIKKGRILYTLNGQEPQVGTPWTYEYNGKIELECGNETTTYAFQICCLFDDGTQTEVYRRDYILDPLGKERFSTDYVVSIAGDEDSLFSDEDGIFVRGNQFYEYIEAHPDVNVLWEVIPANYLSNTELPVHTAIFLKDGTQIIDQNCGIKIYGNFTRQHNQKSFRLYARYDYDEVNEFSYPFFDDIKTYEGNAPITDFQRLSFHNSGNDNGSAFIRSALMGDLARQADFQDTLGAESVTVYINGRYMGVYWLQNTYDDRYFEERYGDYTGEMAVCEGTLSVMDVEMAETDAEHRAAEEYNEFCQWANAADLSNEDNWKRVCDTIDIDNFALYFAFEYYTGNIDWPGNNVKVYKYICEDGEEYKEGTVFDGRYRYLLFDTDYSLGLYLFDSYGYKSSTMRLYYYVNADNNALLFRSLMRRDDFKDLFAEKVMFIMNEIFVRQNVSDEMYALNVTRYNELYHMVEATDMMDGSIWEEWGIGQGGMPHTEQEWAEILTYVEERPQYVISELQEICGYGETIPFGVVMEGNGDIIINSMNAGSEYSGTWIKGLPVEISCDLQPGKVVEGYMLNDTFVEGEVLYLDAVKLKSYSNITIKPVIATISEQSLEIVSYSLSGSQDYIVLENTGEISLNLNEYSLADSEKDLSAGTLPVYKLEPGQKYWVYGEKYTGYMEEPGTQVAFSWNDEEDIYFWHSSTGVIVY